MTDNRKMSRLDDINQQLAHLQWRRMRSERAIQETLAQSKTFKQRDIMSHIVSDELTEKRTWRTAVLEDEFSKPVVVADSEMHDIQASDAATMKKHEKAIVSRIDTVKKIKETLLKQRCNFAEAQELRDMKLNRIIEIESQLNEQLKAHRQSKPLANVVKHTVPKLF